MNVDDELAQLNADPKAYFEKCRRQVRKEMAEERRRLQELYPRKTFRQRVMQFFRRLST